jgi:hypothetical protein
MRAVKGSPAISYEASQEMDARSWGSTTTPTLKLLPCSREIVPLTHDAASNGLKLGSAPSRTELFSLGLLSFSILLTLDQQFCGR